MQKVEQARHGAVPGGATPVAFWAHHPVADQRAETLADATCAFQDRFGCDLVKITPASSFQLRDLGQTDSWNNDPIGRRDFGPPILRHAEDFDRLAESMARETHLSEHLQAARMIRARVPGHLPVLQTVFDPLFQLRVLAGDHWQAHCRECPERIAPALEALTVRTRRTIERFMEAGVDGIFLAVQHAGQETDREASFFEIGLPETLSCLSTTGRDSLNFVHLHGNGIPADLLDAYPETTVHFSFDANPALDEGRRARADALLAGGMSPSRLAVMEGDEVARETRRLIGRMEGRNFTLGAGCALLQATPERNVMAAISAARGYVQ